MSPPLEALALDVDGLAIAGIRHRPRDPDAPKLLCLHGWLDNAASFLPLMPHLPNVELVAIDLPGHGHSDRLAGGGSLFDMALLARRTIEALGWQRCHLAGHSMGGCIAPLLAVGAPDAIERLVLIEAAGPLSAEADEVPARLRRAFDDRLSSGRFASRRFEHPDEAIEARLKATRMARTSARLIVDRQLVESGDGWRWRFDPALRFASPHYWTEDQVRATLAAIRVPVLTVLADKGYLADRARTAARLACLHEHVALRLPGHHHLHMDAPEPVAAAINRFLAALPALGG